MNFTQELSQFQGAILSADNIHAFSALSAKGGNEDEITVVIENISKFLKLGGYTHNGEIVKEKTPTMRQFAFYIVVNAQLPVLNHMLELEGIDSIIWTITKIPQCLMCELMWNVHMDKFIYEIISFTHPLLALEVSAAFLDNFKYFNPLECLDRLKLLSAACYTTITRLHLLNSEADDITSKATAAFHNFKRCLKYFKSPPNEHQLNVLDKDELYEYFGKRLYAMLLLITDCVQCFTSKLEINLAGSDVYMLTYKEGTFKTEIATANVCDIQNNVLSECLNVSHTEMLDECKALVMDVSVDVFCGWSEVEENGKTMQQTIGELCYKVHNNLLRISTISEHPLLAMMEQIARKPDEMEDIINATKDDIILQKVDEQSQDRKIWIQSLIHKEKLCHNLEFLKVISCNLNLFDQEPSQKLYTMFNEYVNLNLENRDYTESLMIKVFHQCSLSTKYMILDEHFKNNLVNMKVQSDFKDSMTETFNKFIATPDSDLSDVLTLFLQNPEEVYTKIFVLATENLRQTEVMLKVMKLFERYSNHYYNSEMEPCIIKITQDIIHKELDSMAKKNNFVMFLCGLKEADIISGSKLLLLIIMTNMHQALITKHVECINFHIKLLKEAYGLEELLVYRAPMLAMIGKVLDVVRWKMNNFSANAPLTLNAALELQKLLFNTYDNSVVPEKESDWLKSKLGNMQPLNMYYYRALWHPPGANYLEVISGSNSNMSKDEMSSWMSQVIASCTQQEWCNIWDSSDKEDSVKLDTFLDAIGMITLAAERANRTENTVACLLYCYRNFVYIIREPLTDSQVIDVIKHIAIIVQLVQHNDDLNDEFASFLLPLFAYLSEKQKDYSINYSEYMNQHMKGALLTTIVNKMFSNGSG
ncbi:Uncharacterized protein OBRU01_12769 [Operophtera brumata]|uniref:Uncharacterized protein n=1 Tax=Operophtera brumata TaxID=104452 RepID=A0A0L7L9K3_OPEBR|nr:Uncharacterized protein OBRU01_12769 [Operophtera brumata]